MGPDQMQVLSLDESPQPTNSLRAQPAGTEAAQNDDGTTTAEPALQYDARSTTITDAQTQAAAHRNPGWGSPAKDDTCTVPARIALCGLNTASQP
ncbi:hypothetical protein E4U19_005365 [Claviceps sp. Clav32 group G5]|nr:hypothetical protein E4U19_005365 [Claviceps sp. Clav32 group G5]KAG6035358.1 hypothetical protein E4U40_002564 [Claviceps sp. LM458 group G5]